MMAFLRKHSTLILMSLLLTMLALAWLFPSAGLKLGIVFLLLSFFIASLLLLEKHQKAYREGKIKRGIFIRNGALEISGVFLVMLLAGPLGRRLAEVVTQGIGHDLVRPVAGIVIALLVGLGVGTLVRKMVTPPVTS